MIIKRIILAMSILMLAGCSGNGGHVASSGQLSPVPPVKPAVVTRKQSAPTLLDALYAQYRQWQGTPWRYGGNSASGLDCSAFTQRVYAQQFGRQLPRTTEQQQRLGKVITQADLQAGDLVFFRPAGRGRHVGVYLENGLFMHVSTRVGVTISKLKSPWWQSAYWKSTRP